MYEMFPFLLASLVGSGINAYTTQRTNNSNLRAASRENDKARIFSADEAQRQRDWMSQEWLSQFKKQTEEWYNQLHASSELQWQNFLKEADYNSPRNQVLRMSQAGINPAAAMANQSSGLVSAASGNLASVPNPSVPSGGTVTGSSASTPSPAVPLQQAPHIDLSSFGSFFESLAKAYKESSSTRPMIENILAQTGLYAAQKGQVEVLSMFQTIQNDILSKTKDSSIVKSFNEMVGSFVDIQVKQALGKNYEASAFNLKAEAFLNDCKSKLTNEQYLQAAFATSHMLETYTNQQNFIRSQTNAQNASAQLSLVSASDIDTRLRVFTQMAPLDFATKKALATKTVEAVKLELEKLVLDNALTREQYKQAVVKLDGMKYETLIDVLSAEHSSYDLDMLQSPFNRVLNWLGLKAIGNVIHDVK